MPPKNSKKGKTPSENKRAMDSEQPSSSSSAEKDMIAIIEDKGPGITLTTKMEALKTKVMSLSLELKDAKNEINEKQREIDTLKMQNNHLNKLNNGQSSGDNVSKRMVDKPTTSGEENDTDEEKPTLTTDVQILQDEVKKLTQKISEMEQFFSDYGLVWIGNQENKDKTVHLKQTTRTYSPNFDKVFTSIDDLNIMATEPQIIHTRSGATFKQCELLNLILYSDGIQLENEAFREYSSLSVKEFFRDIEDGYYPTELKDSYPNGVVFKVIDKRKQTYVEAQGFTGKGQKLGGSSPGNTSDDKNLASGSGEPSKPRNIYVYERNVEVVAQKLNKENTDASKDQSDNKMHTPDKKLNPTIEEEPESKATSSAKITQESKFANIQTINPNIGQASQRYPTLVGDEEQDDTSDPDFKEIWVNKKPMKTSSIFENANNAINKRPRNSENSKKSNADGKNKKLVDESRRLTDVTKNDDNPFDVRIAKVVNYEENFNTLAKQFSKHLGNMKRNTTKKSINNLTNAQKSKSSNGEINELTVSNMISNNMPSRKTEKPTSCRQMGPVSVVSTETSDHLSINLPTYRANSQAMPSGSSGQRGQTQPYNITNINYREAPVNINITPDEAAGLLRRVEGCQRQRQILPDKCSNGKLNVDGKEYSCGHDCSCGCGQKEQPPEVVKETSETRTSSELKRSHAISEYAQNYNGGALNIEADLREQPPLQKIKRKIDPSIGYEHFSYLGHPPDEEDDYYEIDRRKVSEPVRPPQPAPVIALNNKTTDSEISIKVELNNQRYTAYLHPNDPISKILSLLKSRPEVRASQNFHPKISVRDGSIKDNVSDRPASLKGNVPSKSSFGNKNKSFRSSKYRKETIRSGSIKSNASKIVVNKDRLSKRSLEGAKSIDSLSFEEINDKQPSMQSANRMVYDD